MVALVITGIAFAIFTGLLFLGRIGEASYCFLAAVSALLGVVLHGFERLKELDFRNLRVILGEIQEAKEDLFVREERLKRIALPLAQLLAFTASSEGRMSSQSTWAAKRDWYKRKIRELVHALGLDPAEETDTLKYIRKYEEFDRVMGSREGLRIDDPDYEYVEGEIDRIAGELEEMLRTDATLA